MNVTTMKKVDFEQVPEMKSWDGIKEPFSSLVIIPMRKIHSSGFTIMDFVACNDKHEPICRISGCSDVIHIDGIGGFGDWRTTDEIPDSRPIEEWNIDCLPCGYLRLFCRGRITTGSACSDFEIFWNERK